jgi:hypothetical protein
MQSGDKIMKYQYDSHIDRDVIIAKAIKMGWAENKVQVKQEKGFMETWYIIEPYEEGCNCPGLLRYQDFAPIKEEIEG